MIKFGTIWFIILTLSCLCQPSLAQNEKAKLQNIITKISAVKTDINKSQLQQAKVEDELKTTETNIGTLEAKYKNTLNDLQKQQAILKNLTTKQAKYYQQLHTEQAHFFTQIRLAYMLGQEDYLKIMLTQEDPSKFSRMLMYHRYILTSRIDAMKRINNTLKEISQNKVEIRDETKTLKKLTDTQQQQESALTKEKQERTKILAMLSQKIRTQNTTLHTLLADKENLEKLITRLATQKIYHGPEQTFTQMCSKYVWPTTGAITQHYGQSIQGSSWKWTGILIATHEGQPVRAIAAGTVAYADWLAGYGLLLIIDHGRGYMSLYGRNHSVYKEVGDSVTAGETIASVGQSGGYDKPALYFAIRYNGKAINPEKWCKQL